MKQFECVSENPDKNSLCVHGVFAALLQSDFGELDIPVAEYIPDEIIELLNCDAELKSLKIFRYFLSKVVKEAYNPFILEREIAGKALFDFLIADIHQNESRGVPELVCKVAARSDLFIGESHIISWAVARGESESQSIGAVLIYDNERINAVAQRLRHLSALCVSYNTVNEYGVKRLTAHLLHGGEYHSRNPEEDYIITRDKSACGEIMIELGGIIRPSHCRERPESR